MVQITPNVHKENQSSNCIPLLPRNRWLIEGLMVTFTDASVLVAVTLCLCLSVRLDQDIYKIHGTNPYRSFNFIKCISYWPNRESRLYIDLKTTLTRKERKMKGSGTIHIQLSIKERESIMKV